MCSSAHLGGQEGGQDGHHHLPPPQEQPMQIGSCPWWPLPALSGCRCLPRGAPRSPAPPAMPPNAGRHGRLPRGALGYWRLPGSRERWGLTAKTAHQTLDPVPPLEPAWFKLGGLGATDTVHRSRTLPHQYSQSSEGWPHVLISQQERRELGWGSAVAATGLPAASHRPSTRTVPVRRRHRGVAAARGRARAGVAPKCHKRLSRAAGCGRASQR
jgi:hypothetical protein